MNKEIYEAVRERILDFEMNFRNSNHKDFKIFAGDCAKSISEAVPEKKKPKLKLIGTTSCYDENAGHNTFYDTLLKNLKETK